MEGKNNSGPEDSKVKDLKREPPITKDTRRKEGVSPEGNHVQESNKRVYGLRRPPNQERIQKTPPAQPNQEALKAILSRREHLRGEFMARPREEARIRGTQGILYGTGPNLEITPGSRKSIRKYQESNSKMKMRGRSNRLFPRSRTSPERENGGTGIRTQELTDQTGAEVTARKSGRGDNEIKKVVEMGSGVLSLKDHSWSRKYASKKSEDCEPEYNLYCLGKYGKRDHASRGFLGSLAASLMQLNRDLDWNDFITNKRGLKGYILGPNSDEHTWKGLLSCVVSKALQIPSIVTNSENQEVRVWTSKKWQELLKHGTDKDWSRGTTGRNMIMAVGCIIAALMVPRTRGRDMTQEIRMGCKSVWEQVSLELKPQVVPGAATEIQKLKQLIENIREVRGNNEDRYDGFGFLMTLYYGLMSCCKYGRNYELTRLIRKGAWSLDKMGACKLGEGNINCEGQLSQIEGDALNIWTRGTSPLVSSTLRTPPPTIKITAGSDTEDQRDKAKVQEIKEKNEAKKAQLVASRRAAPTNHGIIATPGVTHTLTSNNRQAPVAIPSPPVPLREPSAALPRTDLELAKEEQQTSDVEVSSPQPELRQHSGQRHNRTPDEHHSSLNQTVNNTKVSEEGPSSPDSEPPEAKGAEWEETSTPRHMQRGAEGSGIIGIIGAAVAGLLALASSYGLYRIFKSRKGRNGPENFRREQFIGRVGYGVPQQSARKID
ncbi:hypothetical protein C922_05725 [Plasmodium inui San Antonio 1]|uniref:Uncharacterized protein n=1 Tax=Plasmodium inui San Antonio 1 TaxID=1237626 RepID=W6ZXA6_9APIC|nr:hypothetical protein C922_05725 [Plasmodium inui San Antonio 1]EUD63895.1 hypothetical protein C922_05725 [Plasmodium inui San Antonio 1]